MLFSRQKNRQSHVLTTALTASLIFSTSAFADDWKSTLSGIKEDQIAPSYQAFANSSQALSNRIETLCQSPSASALAKTKDLFAANVDDWQAIQWLNFGPVTYFMRYYAFQYWPDKKGVTQRQLRTLKKDPSVMDQPKFWKAASIAVRGLTAIESLLYRADFNPVNKPADCHLLESIAKHHAETTQSVYKQWSDSAVSDWVFMEEGSTETADKLAMEQVIQQWLEHMSVVKDSKLETPIGYKGKPKPKFAEFYRSDLALASMRTNLTSYQALYHSGNPSLFAVALEQNPETANALDEQLIKNQELVGDLPDNYFSNQLSHEEKVALARPLVSSISQSQTLLTKVVTELGFQIGFNSRDGD
ncbi:peptidase M75, Imelysin [Marinomonas mediterranea]|uniref:imelysin family protein n=1 Tax=Marinomonas mediterranea TaxID=119864 RepID=UPI0023492C01|nr:imelysin family protein [Marinomonas mediterranea]WCN12924.1 peptidase M75, Imelysin [Marinomonas mediterranea]